MRSKDDTATPRVEVRLTIPVTPPMPGTVIEGASWRSVMIWALRLDPETLDGEYLVTYTGAVAVLQEVPAENVCLTEGTAMSVVAQRARTRRAA